MDTTRIPQATAARQSSHLQGHQHCVDQTDFVPIIVIEPCLALFSCSISAAGPVILYSYSLGSLPSNSLLSSTFTPSYRTTEIHDGTLLLSSQHRRRTHSELLRSRQRLRHTSNIPDDYRRRRFETSANNSTADQSANLEQSAESTIRLAIDEYNHHETE